MAFLPQLLPFERLDFLFDLGVVERVGLERGLHRLVIVGGVDEGGGGGILGAFRELCLLFLGHNDNKYNEIVLLEISALTIAIHNLKRCE